jgi:hypothetical protein
LSKSERDSMLAIEQFNSKWTFEAPSLNMSSSWSTRALCFRFSLFEHKRILILCVAMHGKIWTRNCKSCSFKILQERVNICDCKFSCIYLIWIWPNPDIYGGGGQLGSGIALRPCSFSTIALGGRWTALIETFTTNNGNFPHFMHFHFVAM